MFAHKADILLSVIEQNCVWSKLWCPAACVNHSVIYAGSLFFKQQYVWADVGLFECQKEFVNFFVKFLLLLLISQWLSLTFGEFIGRLQ